MKKIGLKGILGITLFSLYLSGCGVPDSQVDDAMDVSDNEIDKIYMAGDDVEFDIRPQDDFYGYVNAQYLWNMEIPYDSSTNGTFDIVAEQVDEELKDIVREVVSSNEEYETGTDEQFIRDYYNLVKSGNYTNEYIFDEVFSYIESADDMESLSMIYANMSYLYGVDCLFPFGIEVDSYDPSRYTLVLQSSSPIDADLEDMYEYDDSVNDFREQISDCMSGYGMDKGAADDMSDDMAYIWIDIACNTDFESAKNMDAEKMLNKYSLDEFQQLLTHVDVETYFNTLGYDADKIDYIYVQDPVQLDIVNKSFTEDNLDLWKEYAKCAFVSQYSIYAPDEYTNNDSYFDDMDEDKILDEVVSFCGENLSNLYLDKYYTDEMDEYMHRMEDDIKASYINMISEADWLSLGARGDLIEKFENIEFHYGGEKSDGPNLDRAKVLSDTMLETKIRSARYANDEMIQEYYTVPDHNKWSMPAQTVNAYYDPNNNSIYITRGIMNGAFFDMDADYYSNLGALGVVIGHELSHAFDSNGIKYDKNGKYNPSWISDADQDAFQEIVDAVDAHYDEYALLEVYHVDGKQTVAENLADIGGMECILGIADTKEEYELVFAGYARVWCTLYQNKDLIHYLEDDSHSPDIVRVNAVLSCFQEFYDCYDVVEGDGMYIAPENRVIRW